MSTEKKVPPKKVPPKPSAPQPILHLNPNKKIEIKKRHHRHHHRHHRHHHHRKKRDHKESYTSLSSYEVPNDPDNLINFPVKIRKQLEKEYQEKFDIAEEETLPGARVLPAPPRPEAPPSSEYDHLGDRIAYLYDVFDPLAFKQAIPPPKESKLDMMLRRASHAATQHAQETGQKEGPGSKADTEFSGENDEITTERNENQEQAEDQDPGESGVAPEIVEDEVGEAGPLLTSSQNALLTKTLNGASRVQDVEDKTPDAIPEAKRGGAPYKRTGWSVGRNLGTTLVLREQYDSLRSKLHSKAFDTLGKSSEVLEILNKNKKSKEGRSGAQLETKRQSPPPEIPPPQSPQRKEEPESVFKWSPAKKIAPAPFATAQGQRVSSPGESKDTNTGINPLTGEPWPRMLESERFCVLPAYDGPSVLQPALMNYIRQHHSFKGHEWNLPDPSAEAALTGGTADDYPESDSSSSSDEEPGEDSLEPPAENGIGPSPMGTNSSFEALGESLFKMDLQAKTWKSLEAPKYADPKEVKEEDMKAELVGIIYETKEGDTLNGIANRFHLMHEKIVAANMALFGESGNDPSAELLPGMLLKLEVRTDVIAVVSPRPLRRHALSGGVYRNERENPTAGSESPISKLGRISKPDFATQIKNDSWVKDSEWRPRYHYGKLAEQRRYETLPESTSSPVNGSAVLSSSLKNASGARKQLHLEQDHGSLYNVSDRAALYSTLDGQITFQTSPENGKFPKRTTVGRTHEKNLLKDSIWSQGAQTLTFSNIQQLRQEQHRLLMQQRAAELKLQEARQKSFWGFGSRMASNGAYDTKDRAENTRGSAKHANFEKYHQYLNAKGVADSQQKRKWK